MTRTIRFLIAQLIFCSLLASTASAASARAHDRIEPLNDQDRYIAGGIVGTLVGFGIGHAIENRYRHKGWLFTVTEASGVALIVVGAVVPMPRAASVPLIVVGALGLAGFKVWEIVDIWIGPGSNYEASSDTPTSRSRFSQNILTGNDVDRLVPQIGLTLHF